MSQGGISYWETWKLRLVWLASCLVFFGLPIFIVGLCVNLSWRSSEKAEWEEIATRHGSIIRMMKIQEDPIEYFTRLTRTLVINSTRRKGNTLTEKRIAVVRALENALKKLRKRFPGIFQIVIADHNGSISRNWTDRNISQEILRLLYFFCLSDGADLAAGRLIQEKWHQVMDFIGERVAYRVLSEPDRAFFDASNNDERRYFSFFTTKFFGIFIHARRTSLWPVLPVVDRGNRMSRFPSMKNFDCGVMEISRPESSPKAVVEAYGDFLRSGISPVGSGGKIFSFSSFNPDFVVWVSTREKSMKSHSWQKFSLVIAGGFLFVLLSLFLFRLQYMKGEFYFSIRGRLIFLFAYAGGLPIMFLAGASMDYLGERHETRIRETQEEMEQMLRGVDSGFQTFRGQFEIFLQKKIRSLEKKDTREKDIFKLLTGICEEIQASKFILYSQKGKAIWVSHEQNFDEKSGGKLFESVVQNVFAQINNSSVDAMFDPVSLVAEDLGDEENPLMQIRKNLNRIVRFETNGNFRGRIFFAPIRDGSGKAKYLLRGFWSKTQLDDLYLTHRLEKLQTRLPSTLLYTMSFSHHYSYPRDFRFRNELKSFASDLFVSQGSIYGRFRKNSADYLITGICTTELDSGILFAVKPLRLIDREISRLRGKVWLFNLLMVLFCIFLGLILSERFLAPIHGLASAVRAIEERRFDFRIPPGEKDEFGRLGETFNDVMENLAELDVARIVQESLLPADEFNSGEYRIFGLSHSATQLGGDYLEIKHLPDGRIFFLIGDVSGHGIAAALIMAMAKALVEKECENPTSTEKIMLPFNRLIFKTMKWRRMMTCFIGILDPRDNTLTLTNAGHNYPFFFRVGESPVTIELRSTPLGTSKLPRLSTKVIRMMPGDRIFFYTDGLIEAKFEGAPLGYDRVLENVSRIITFEPRPSCRDVMLWHRSLTGSVPQEDDITIAILSRLPATE